MSGISLVFLLIGFNVGFILGAFLQKIGLL